MIINLICGDNIFTSNDKQWNKIRGIIYSASYEFILDYKNNLIIHETNVIDETKNILENDDHNCNEYNYYQKTFYEKTVNKESVMKNIDNILKDIKINNYYINPKKDKIKTNESFLKLYKNYLNLLTILGLSGIYSLLNTQTDEINCFYSIGNSYDIANAIDLVLPFINNEYIEHLIFEVLMIFNHSVKNNLVVSVTRESEVLENKIDCYENKKKSLIRVIHKKGGLSSKLFMSNKTHNSNIINNNDIFIDSDDNYEDDD